MKSAMPYRGVAAPTLKRTVADALRAHVLASFEQWRDVALDLWRRARFREERYAAMLITGGSAAPRS